MARFLALHRDNAFTAEGPFVYLYFSSFNVKSGRLRFSAPCLLGYRCVYSVLIHTSHWNQSRKKLRPHLYGSRKFSVGALPPLHEGHDIIARMTSCLTSVCTRECSILARECLLSVKRLMHTLPDGSHFLTELYMVLYYVFLVQRLRRRVVSK